MKIDFDFAQSLFGWLWSPRRSSEDLGAQGQGLGALLERADRLAAMLAGERMSMRQAEGSGGVSEGVLLLPGPSILPGNSPAQRWDFLRVRVVLDVARLELRSQSAQQDGREQSEWLRAENASLDRLPSSQQLGAAWQWCAESARAARFACAKWPEFEHQYSRAQALELEQLPPVQGAVRRKQKAGLAEWLRLRSMWWSHAEEAEQGAFDEQLTQLAAQRELICPPFVLWGGPIPASVSAPDPASVASAQSEQDESEEAAVQANASELEAKAKDHVERMQMDGPAEHEVMPEHVFEKIETAEEYQGGRRRMDGSDELDDHQAALDELDLRQLIRGGPPVDSVYRAEVDAARTIPDVQSTEPDEKAVYYSEWDSSTSSYRHDWAAVYPASISARVDSWSAELRQGMARDVDRLARELRTRRDGRLRMRRRLEGNDIDLAEVIAETAAVRAGCQPTGRVFVDQRRLLRDFACSVLIDVSLSADSWVGNRRVLDAVRESALLMGEIADRLDDAYRLQAFASNTRNMNRVWTVKDWSDVWETARDRLGALQPQGYTRIGPALRHATAGLAEHPARKRLLVLLTDGRPTDYDRYEGRYGRADVGKAVQEARAQGVRVFALGFDPRASRDLGEMFGTDGWARAASLDDLPNAVRAAYRNFGE